MNKKIGISFLTLSLSLYLTSADLIEGDKDAPEGQTFSFNVNKNIFGSNGSFYEGTNAHLTANQDFALSYLPRASKAFIPLAPETVTLGGAVNAPNPLYGQEVVALGTLTAEDGLGTKDMPVVVVANNPAKVFLLEKITSPTNIEIEFSQDVHDAQGNVSPGIIDLTTNIKSHVFAAVKPNGGEFGDRNSGIALLIRGIVSLPEGSDHSGFRIFSELNVNTGSIIEPQALLLDPTSPAIAINNPLSNIATNQVAMHWDPSLEQLFIGLETTAGGGLNDGTRAVAVCAFTENGGIALQKIAPDSVFNLGNTSSIIGAQGSSQQVSIHAINSMYTSTALNYLIVVGGNGKPASTQQSVFALPLVNAGNAKGMIAQKDAQPVNVFRSGSVPRLIGRAISEPATNENEMTQSTDTAAQVGGGQLAAGPIVNIIVRDDTVFAFVGENTPGVYSSQAIFDAAGKITSWTRWQRAAGTTDNIFAAALNPFDGNFILASGTTANTVNTIKRTVWSDGSPEGLQPLTTILDSTFSLENGGIQGMQTFLPNTPGLQNISMLAAGGIGNILLAQTGILNGNGIIIPTTGPDFNQLQEFTDGAITSNVAAKTVVISGGVLDEIGPITALETGRNTSNGWFFVGGSNGLAVLTRDNGTGWNPLTELSDNLTGLTAGMNFKTIGNYTFVKKLIYGGDLVNYNFLYVITHDKVDRINLNTSDFGTNTLDVITIASVGHNGVAHRGGFLDGIFSQALGILATTDGLLRIGNGKDIRAITNEADADWTAIAIGENAGAPTALYTVTTTNRLQNITNFAGGYFYVLTADVGLNQSRINRFAVQPLAANQAVSTTTVQAFDDLFVKNIPSFLLSFGEFRSNFATDGALYFATRNQNVNLLPIAMLTSALLVPRVGVGNVGDRSSTVAINFQQGSEINYFSRSAASGSWIAAGNFNTQTLE